MQAKYGRSYTVDDTLSPMKILLIQIRRDASLLAAERSQFVSCSGLSDAHFTTLDVFRKPDFSATIVDEYQILMIGGLSDDASDKIALPHFFDPFLHNLNAVIRRAMDKKIPSLLSCGGFMLASMLLGASVVIDPNQAELGVYKIRLTSEAKKDVLFGTFPNEFEAVSGHIKSTVGLPDTCIHLARSEICKVHGFKVDQAPFYAFQFHPEITCENLVARVEAYKDKYFDSEEGYQAFINMSHDTSVANSIISRFVNLVREGKFMEHTKDNRQQNSIDKQSI